MASSKALLKDVINRTDLSRPPKATYDLRGRLQSCNELRRMESLSRKETKNPGRNYANKGKLGALFDFPLALIEETDLSATIVAAVHILSLIHI